MLYDELSTNLGLWHVNSMVLPPKLINGAVGGVKFAVYNATPMLNLKLLIYPGKYAGADVSHRLPTYNPAVDAGTPNHGVVIEPLNIPFTNIDATEPLNDPAM